MQSTFVTVVGVAAGFTAAASAQLVEFDLSVDGEVNGEEVSAAGGGELDLDQEGRSNASLMFTERPDSFNPITASLISNLCGNVFVEGEGASNLATLTGGNYSVSRTLQWSGFGGGMTLDTRVTNPRNDAWIGETVINGTYEGPNDVVGILDYLVTWIPSSTPGEFFEAASATLLRENGETFVLQIASVYSGFEGSLGERQFGRGSFDVAFDGTTLTFGWDGAFAVVPAPGAAALLGLAGLTGSRRRR